jgi:hypothetical protein
MRFDRRDRLRIVLVEHGLHPERARGVDVNRAVVEEDALARTHPQTREGALENAGSGFSMPTSWE